MLAHLAAGTGGQGGGPHLAHTSASPPRQIRPPGLLGRALATPGPPAGQQGSPGPAAGPPPGGPAMPCSGAAAVEHPAGLLYLGCGHRCCFQVRLLLQCGLSVIVVHAVVHLTVWLCEAWEHSCRCAVPTLSVATLQMLSANWLPVTVLV